MNFRLTLILAIVLALVAMVYFITPSSQVEKKTEGGTTELIPGRPDLTSITYLRDDVVEIRFEKQDQEWRMTSPVNARVESYRVESIASTLSGIAYTRKFEPESTGTRSPEYTGTARPRDVVKIVDNTRKEYTLSFGKRSAEGVFATLDGGKTIYVLAANPIDQLSEKPDSFRDRQIRRVDSSKVVKLDIKTPQGDVTLEKADGKWLIAAPITARANAATVEAILNDLSSIMAISFSTLDKKTAGTESPQVSITAHVDDSAPAAGTQPATAPDTQTQPAPEPKLTAVTLQFGVMSDPLRRDTSSVYASLADSPEVFTYNRDAFNRMNKELKDLRDPAITPAPVTQATELEIHGPEGARLSLTRKDEDWQITAPLDTAADALAVSDYLGRLRDLRAIRHVDNVGNLQTLGLDPPQIVIDMAVPGQSQREVIHIGAPETADQVTPVMRQGEKTVYLIQTPDAENLKTTALALRSRKIEQLDANAIRTIAITGPAATAGIAAPSPATASATAPATEPAAALPPGVTLAREGTQWLVQKDGKSQPSDETKVQSLLGSLSPLMALRYLEATAAVSGTPDVTVTVSILESTTPATPATSPAGNGAAEPLPATPVVGPDPGRIVVRTLRLYKSQSEDKTTWKALWDHQSPTWVFEPTPGLVDQVTQGIYTPTADAPAQPDA